MALVDLTPNKYIFTEDKIECRRCGQTVKRELPRNKFEQKQQSKALFKLSVHDCNHYFELRQRVQAELAKSTVFTSSTYKRRDQ